MTSKQPQGTKQHSKHVTLTQELQQGEIDGKPVRECLRPVKYQARSQNLNKEEAFLLPYPPFPSFSPLFHSPFLSLPLSFPLSSLLLPFLPFRSRTPSPIAAKGSGEQRSRSPSGARPPNAFGLSQTRLVTSLVLLCDRVTCNIAGLITRSRHSSPRASTYSYGLAYARIDVWTVQKQ